MGGFDLAPLDPSGVRNPPPDFNLDDSSLKRWGIRTQDLATLEGVLIPDCCRMQAWDGLAVGGLPMKATRKEKVRRQGLEPWTNWLKANCSTN